MYLILLSRAIVDVIRCLFHIRQYKNGENCIDGGNVKCTFLMLCSFPLICLLHLCGGRDLFVYTLLCWQKKTSQHHFNVHVMKSRRLVNKDNELKE